MIAKARARSESLGLVGDRRTRVRALAVDAEGFTDAVQRAPSVRLQAGRPPAQSCAQVVCRRIAHEAWDHLGRLSATSLGCASITSRGTGALSTQARPSIGIHGPPDTEYSPEYPVAKPIWSRCFAW